MNQISRIEKAHRDAKHRQELEDRSNVIRKAWDLVEPDPYDRDPQWLRIAASLAAKAGRLPRYFAGESVLTMLFDAGYEQTSAGLPVRDAGQTGRADRSQRQAPRREARAQ